jgi:hypothetical protein
VRDTLRKKLREPAVIVEFVRFYHEKRRRLAADAHRRSGRWKGASPRSTRSMIA